MSQTFRLLSDERGTPWADILGNVARFAALLPRSKSWRITFEEDKPERSEKQRKALFGAAYKACMEFMGLSGAADKEELHRFWCGEFFGWKNGAFGQKVPVRTTTKDENGKRDQIDVDTALKMYAFIQRRSAEVGCWVPDPDPFWMEKAT